MPSAKGWEYGEIRHISAPMEQTVYWEWQACKEVIAVDWVIANSLELKYWGGEGESNYTKKWSVLWKDFDIYDQLKRKQCEELHVTLHNVLR